MARRSIACKTEVLRYITEIMRCDGHFADEIKLSDSFRAAELLGKHYGLFSGKQEKKAEGKRGVTIIDNIPRGEDK